MPILILSWRLIKGLGNKPDLINMLLRSQIIIMNVVKPKSLKNLIAMETLKIKSSPSQNKRTGITSVDTRNFIKDI